ncbi:peptidylprolyl isomerase [Corynebacterium antarcticum]|uniref:Peptidylprolyl isomerase n=1 Tax=Corynebacterium antarcticum TaxID=2800405 RepID=A0A9Q4CAK7_9CORY|nr:peptidylprolyl isomerase [Corynebacterium antarcticum]MCK7641525.1 peptidylprolyl isomerase [Corynebacterium antarcticum]MCK7660377.1 peptidylprolyl isomerase [Corynebacterium antarcticum]MCX7491126.1 peptidylprolyl isomerase [Corynebacterium antarcticum]MCX7537151.1 peptidylprolyl isomerase [Corynebacterium antarcticum]MCX7539691.1 peptidylprolyl isomerase [Corynebacterium antarcticum]
MSSNRTRRTEAMKKLEQELKSRDRSEKTKPLTVALASLAVIALIVGGIWFLNTQTGSDDSTLDASEQTTQTSAANEEPVTLTGARSTALGETVSCTYDSAGQPAAREIDTPTHTTDVPATGTVNLTLNTNRGPIPLTLDRAASPCTVNAIEHLAYHKYYDDTICHRLVTAGIHVLQCGDPTGTGTGGPGFVFPNEYPTDDVDDPNAPVVYPRGSIAMANSGPGTNGSQFFLNYEDSTLPAQYTYFGTIGEEGLATLDTIAEAGVSGDGGGETPAEEVRITTAELG